MKKSRSYVIAGLLAAGVLVAGCGGDDDDTDTAADTGATTEETSPEDEATALSEDEYRTEVEGVLTPLGEGLQEIGNETSNQTTPEGVADGLAQAEDELETAITDLQAIQPPENLQEPHERLIAALEDFQQATADAREGAESGDVQAIATDYVQAATDFQTELAQVVQDFQDAGLEIQPQSGSGGGN